MALPQDSGTKKWLDLGLFSLKRIVLLSNIVTGQHGRHLNARIIASQTNQILDRLTNQYRENQDGITVSFRELCSNWPWAKRSDVCTHQIHSYPAKMFPYIPIFFLSTERYASREDSILDVFAGSATVLLESIIHPVFPRDAYGIELNPLARLIAKVKTTVLDPERVSRIASEVVAVARATRRKSIPNYQNLDYWYSEKIKRKLGKLVWALNNVETDNNTRDFLAVCLSATTRKCSYADPDIPVPVHLKCRLPDKEKPSIEKRNALVRRLLSDIDSIDPVSVFSNIVNANVERLRMLCVALQGKTKKARIIGMDAKSLQDMAMGPRGQLDQAHARAVCDRSFPLIITSPPYGAAQKYIRSTRLEMLWLGLASVEEVTALEKQSIGTEAVSESSQRELIGTGFKPIDEQLEQISKKELSRACLESAYFRDMTAAIREMHRVLRPNGTLVMVIGDNTACSMTVPNHQYLRLIAESMGFRQNLLLKDPVRSRGMMTKRHESAGMVTDDWVLILRKDN